MPSKIESPLNPIPVLRYDGRHDGDPDEATPLSAEPSPPQAGTADMEVNGLGSVPSTNPLKSLRPATPPVKPAESRALNPKDTVEISAAGRAAEASKSTSLRAERLAQIKASIEAGTYDTPERLEAALGRMFASLGIDAE